MKKELVTIAPKKVSKINQPFSYSRFAAAILEQREQDSKTLRTMSVESGVPIATCYRAEAIADKLDINTVINICNWLNKPLQFFLTSQTKKNVQNKNKSSSK